MEVIKKVGLAESKLVASQPQETKLHSKLKKYRLLSYLVGAEYREQLSA